MPTFTILQKGSTEFIEKPRAGKTGNLMPHIQIYLEDYQRISVWINPDKTVSWQYVADDKEVRAKWDIQRAQIAEAKAASKKTVEAAAKEKPLVDEVDEVDDLPF